MSRWTHISASILCNITNKQENKNDFKLRIEKMLGKAPKITGSEGNADVFVNIFSKPVDVSSKLAFCKMLKLPSCVLA